MHHLPPLIHDLAVILGVAAAVSILFHSLRLPVILGYVAVGILVSPNLPYFVSVTDTKSIEVWGELGVIFLMFTLGLDFSFRKLAAVGLRASFAGIFEVAGMFALGFFLGQLMGWNSLTCIFAGATLSISSTTIIVKSIENLNFQRRRFRDHVFGILIVEDLIAVLILVLLSTMVTRGQVEGLGLLLVFLQMIIVVGCWMIIGFFLVPRFLRWTARLKSDELLTILSLALCLILVSVGAYFGYSAALGAFIMGSIIGETKESRLIENLIRPMRDLFAAIFFVSIGMRVNPSLFPANWQLIITVTFLVIFGKTIFVFLGSLLSGQRLRHSIQSAMAMAQIGEFSFLIAGLALSLKVADENFFAVVVAVSLITMMTTPLFMKWSDPAANLISAKLSPKTIDTLDKYSLILQIGQGLGPSSNLRAPLVLKWFANGVLITAVFLTSAKLLLPLISKSIENSLVSQSATWLITCAFAAPFLWGMANAFRKSSNPGALLMSRIIALLWVGALSAQILSAWTSVIITVAAVVLVILLFHPSLDASYDWLETKFLASFEDGDDSGKQRAMSRLAPWDAHLVQLNVHPDSPIVGKSLVEAKLREQFGLNVVAIQRGMRVIVAPSRDERFYPQDELLVLASEDEIERAREAIEGYAITPVGSQDLIDFDLKPLAIAPENPLVGKSILSSRLRETYGVLVVGVEREGKRLMNPPSQLIFAPGDRVWVVGDRSKLRDL